MLSHTCKTAVKAVIFLATKFDRGEKSGIREIAEYIGASLKGFKGRLLIARKHFA